MAFAPGGDAEKMTESVMRHERTRTRWEVRPLLVEKAGEGQGFRASEAVLAVEPPSALPGISPTRGEIGKMQAYRFI